jgi:hypothetical protein
MPKFSILPEMLTEGRGVIERKLMPCGAEAVGPILVPLMISLRRPGEDGMSPDQVAAYYAEQREVYIKHLKDVPRAILEDACFKHTRISNFFPTVHELLIHAEPEIAKLQWQRRWIDRMIEHQKQPHKTEAFVEDPPHIKLLTGLKWQEKPGSPLYNHAKAAKSRRDLDALAKVERDASTSEGRECAEWASVDYLAGISEAVAPTAEPQPKPPVHPSERSRAVSVGDVAQAVAERARPNDGEMDATPSHVEPWRAGDQVYRRPPEEPPPHDAVPEAEF